jgi:hypothetical protein
MCSEDGDASLGQKSFTRMGETHLGWVCDLWDMMGSALGLDWDWDWDLMTR